MKEMNIEYLSPGVLTPYPANAKKHPDDQVKHIANSIREFGFRQPIVVDADNVVVIGHGRLMAAKSLRLDSVPVVRADDLTDEQIRALRLADNKTNESEWDFAELEAELAELEMDFDMSDFGFTNEETSGYAETDQDEDGDKKYTNVVNIPQYEPSGECPDASEIYDRKKYDELISHINSTQLSVDVKEFLTLAAARHIAFNYKHIADFYAHQDAVVQRLMEDSALVIIDINDAIKHGYAELRERLEEIEELDDEE